MNGLRVGVGVGFHQRDDPSSDVSLSVDKWAATPPLKSLHHGNHGPDISKTKIIFLYKSRGRFSCLIMTKGRAVAFIFVYCLFSLFSFPFHWIIILFLQIYDFFLNLGILESWKPSFLSLCLLKLLSWYCFLYLNVSFFHFPLFPICSLIRPAFKMLCQMSFSFSNAEIFLCVVLVREQKLNLFKKWIFYSNLSFSDPDCPGWAYYFPNLVVFYFTSFLSFCILAPWINIWNIISAAVTVATSSQIFFFNQNNVLAHKKSPGTDLS